MTLTNRKPADHSDRSSGYVSCNMAGGTGPNNTENGYPQGGRSEALLPAQS